MECQNNSEPRVITRSRTNSFAATQQDHKSSQFPKYKEHDDITNRPQQKTDEFMKQQMISVISGENVPKPIQLFTESSLPKNLLKTLSGQDNFVAPTSIQAQAWPIALQGRDLIGIAQTGSGKTLGFLMPAIVHIINQPKQTFDTGPIALVLAPTRELAIQIEEQAQKFAGSCGIKSLAVYGGVSKYAQAQKLRAGVSLLIATPGRLMDFLQNRTTNLNKVSYLCLDEADRMLDMGFEKDIKKIIAMIYCTQRQTLMFSATWPKDIQKLAHSFCTNNTVHIKIGETDSANMVKGLTVNSDIDQIVKVVHPRARFDAFKEVMSTITENNTVQKKVIIFCLRKCDVDNLENKMLNDEQFNKSFDCEAWAIHGDKLQYERDTVYKRFKQPQKGFKIKKNGQMVDGCNILIATDVASRGLDVKDIDVVINYEMPKLLEDYTHRIGRCGRAGAKGVAYSFFAVDKDAGLANDLCKLLEIGGKEIPQELANCRKSKGGRGGGRGGPPKPNTWGARPQHKAMGNNWSKQTNSQSISFDGGYQNKRQKF